MTRSTTFFLTDDDADDRLLMIEAIKTIDPSIKIVESENGQELLNVLQSQAIFDRCLIIIDMNMPKMNGLETLSNLRNIPHLASLPTIMLSTSGNPDMIDFAKKLGAIDYLIKPSTMDGLINLSRQLILEKLGSLNLILVRFNHGICVPTITISLMKKLIELLLNQVKFVPF